QEFPANKFWDFDYLEKNTPQRIHVDHRSGQPRGQFWWAGDSGEVSMFWYTYQSRWLPLALFEKKNAKNFSQILFDATRLWEGGFELHFNKGLAGASIDAIEKGRETPMNPAVYDAAALIITGAGKQGIFPGLNSYAVNESEAREQIRKVSAAMKIITDATPESGSYLNEADYFQKNWQHAFWGKHYPRLLKIKQKYDPNGLFKCHHSVGSE
ncbi:MAG TPA: BBE domain-containing protein, partial [Waddliaceae bacterium]